MKRWVFMGTSLVLIIGTVLLVYLITRDDRPFDGQLQTQVSFRIIYPTDLPPGFKLKEDSFIASGGNLSYTLSSGEREIVVIQQNKPSQPLAVELPRTTEMTVSAGKVTVSRFQDSDATIITLESPDSLVFFNTSSKLTDSEIKLLTENLRSK